MRLNATGSVWGDIAIGLIGTAGSIFSSGNNASVAQANAAAQAAAANAQANANLTELELAKLDAEKKEAERLADQKSQQTLLIAGFGGITFIGILLFLFKKK